MHPFDSSPIVSPKTLWIIVGTCVAAALFFIPDTRELVNRLDKDGQVERLKALADEALSTEDVVTETPKTDRERLRAWLTNPDSAVRNDPAVQADQKIMCAITEKPLEVAAELVANAGQIDRDLFTYLADALARRALGLQKPSEAGWILTEWFKLEPSWDLANRAVESWRWGRHSDQALKVLGLALQANLDSSGAPPRLDDLRVKLALESSQPNLAFDIELARYNTSSEDERPERLRRLVELANSGDRTTEASHLIAEHLKQVPFHLASIPEAIALARNGEAFSSASEENCYRDYAAAMARWQEWSNHGPDAINTWLHLAILDHQEGWTRSLDLYEDVLRQRDFAKVLAYRIERGMSLEKQKLLADLLTESGDLETALTHYTATADQSTDPVPSLRPIARIHQQAGDWEKTISTFSEILRYLPDDVEARKGTAFALVRLHRYDEACKLYTSLAAALPEDAELQETCASLCDSLGYELEARTAIQRLLACTTRTATPEEHLELADRFRVADDQAGLIKTLRTGLHLFPSSSRLRFSLAESVAAQGSHDEAVQLLAHETLRSNPAALELLISEAMEATNSSLACTFLGDQVPPCLASLPASRLRLAFLLEREGHALAGSKIIDQLLHQSTFRQTTVWLALGRLSLDFGSTERAESFITLYLASIGSTDSKAWELLGDIYKAANREDEALTAYRKAVEVLRPVTINKTEPAPLKVSQATLGSE